MRYVSILDLEADFPVCGVIAIDGYEDVHLTKALEGHFDGEIKHIDFDGKTISDALGFAPVEITVTMDDDEIKTHVLTLSETWLYPNP